MKKILLLFWLLLLIVPAQGQIIRASGAYNKVSSSPSTLLNGLVAYWALDEASGNCVDATGNGHTGTPSGTLTQNVAGKIGKCITFASSGKVTVDLTTVSATKGTFSCWINQDGVAGAYGIMGDGNFATDRNGMMFRTSTTHLLWEIGTATDYQAATDTSVMNATDVFHITLTWNGSFVDTYVNGALKSHTAQTKTPICGVNNFVIGINNGSGQFLGEIDEVAVYNRALGNTGVDSLYDAGVAGKSYPFTP